VCYLFARRPEHRLAQDISADAGIDVCREEAGDLLPADDAIARDSAWNEANDLVLEVVLSATGRRGSPTTDQR
jgi:hypothetical protein